MATEQTLDLPAAELSEAKRALLAARLGGRVPRAAIVPRPSGGAVPLSFAQERLWFLHRLQQGGDVYNLPCALRIAGGVDEPVLERALGEVVRRHASLRTTFHEADGVASQVVAPFAGFALPVVDLSALASGEREAEVERRARDDAAQVFDLSAGPLFRARLLRLGADGHVLLVCMHHIVSDGWSVEVLFRETWALYDAFRRGAPSPLAELAVQYADYAVWQREEWETGSGARQLEYWRQRLAGAPEVLELPTDRPRPAAPSFRGGSVPVSVSAPVLDRLRALGRDEGATPFMVVLAAFQLLLARHAATDDVVVGTLTAGRTRGEVAGLVGLFMNTLVLRTGLAGDPTFRELVGRARDTVLGAWDHQGVPFEKLVAELRPERSLSHSTLFQVLYQLDAARPAPAPAPRGTPLELDTETTKFDLALLLDAGLDGVTGTLEYSADLFDPDTAERMAARLHRLLDQAAADPDRPISRMELADAAERRQVTLEWNRTDAPYPADRTIHELFQAQAAATPGAVAVHDGARTLTYAELDRRANGIAHQLRERGVGPEVRVGLLLEREPEMLAALLGVLKAGGTFVPLDHGHPPERLAYMLEDSGARVLLTRDAPAARAPEVAGVARVSLDALPSLSCSEPPPGGADSENLAYVIYTSGSTGRPKGVAMHHRGVCNYIDWGIRAYGAAEGSGAPVFTSMAVDLTLTNLLPLFAGRPVWLVSERSPVEALAAALREGPGFGLIKITPIHLGVLTPMLSPDDAPGAARTLVIGADSLSAETTLFWQEHAPGVRLMNEYGPTETVVGCSAYLLPPGEHRTGPVPVGRPIQNLRFYVLDAALRPVPVGVPGELYIGGAGVARGYLGRPGLSAEKFVPDPYAGPGARMYRTGDRARWRADGNLMFLGRRDNQVKIRGYRVELGEVDAALRRHPAVRDCLVVAREDRPGDRRLVGYVAGSATPAELAAHLRRTLPEHMVPEAFVVMDALPQTHTGKLDPRALPAPRYAAAQPGAGAPRDSAEVQMVRIWEELLGVEPIGVAQSFFDVGGNSLLALRLLAVVKRRLGCELPVAALFAAPTVRRLAAKVVELRRSGAAQPDPVFPLQPLGERPPLFCVHPADRRAIGYLYLARQLAPDQPVWGVEDVGDDLARPLGRIAAEHVRAVRAVRPRGPYHLVGWSFGGFVAFEMAVQLQAAGERVDFLGLFDTLAPHAVALWPDETDAELAVGVAHDIAAQMERPFSMQAKEVEGLDDAACVRRVVEALHAQGAAPAEFDEAALAEHCRTFRDRVRSRAGYVPGPFTGTLTLFRASEGTEEMERFLASFPPEERRTMGWSRVAPGRVDVRPVPGSHVTLGSGPNAPALARSVRQALAAVGDAGGARAGEEG